MAEQETPINDLEAQSIETQAETIAGKQVLTAITAGTGISETTVNGNSTINNTGVLTFNTRSGAVTPASGDYTVSEVTGAAASGANSDITSLTGLTTPIPISEGGTGSTTASAALIALGIQSGTTASTAITTPTTITFAVAFAAAPTVVASAVADTATVAVTATTATTFTYEVATVASAVTWIAIAV